MIEGIGAIFSTSPVANLNPSNIQKSSESKQNPSASQALPEAVKLTLSPEAQKLMGKDQKNQTKSDKNGIIQPDNNNQQSLSNTEDSELSPAEKRLVQKLKQTDHDVRIHEQQHLAAAAGYVKGGPVYNYTTGPDGKRYATGGHVSLDMSPVPNNPEATIRKAQTIKRAALAPADPSGADRAVSSAAAKMEASAKEQIRMERTKNLKQALAKGHRFIKAYTQTNHQTGKNLNLLL